MKNYTVNTLLDMLDDERATLQQRTMDKSNRNDALKKIALTENILLGLDGNILIKNIEGCRGDGLIRNNEFINIGSVVEAVVRTMLGKTSEKTLAGRDCGRYEIKASLTAKSLCTPPKEASVTLIVNQLGVWKCYKKDFDLYLTAKKGTRFPHNAPCGIYMNELSEALGFDGEW